MQADRELVESVLRGDRAAFAELVRRYERVALSAAWNILRDYHHSQDATQNAFVEAFRQLPQLRNREHFGAWVIRIVSRESLRIVRAAPRTLPFESAIEHDPVEELPTDDWQDLLAAVGRLPDQERLVVGLRYFEGYSVIDIATVTGRPPGTVTKQLSRAIHRLKSMVSRRSSNHDTAQS